MPSPAPLPTADAALASELAALAEVVAREAAVEIRRGLERTRQVTATKSSATDVVTDVDQAVERLVVGRLMEARPADAVLGEEGGSRQGGSGVRWLVDPIDGTVNFLYGHPGFCVSIAAEVDGAMAAGVVIEPWRGEVFRAVAAGGATLDGRPIRANAASDPAACLVATGFSYRAEERAAQARAMGHLLPRVRDIRRVGSAALDLCDVACGRVDAYYEWDVNPWDVAAGSLIATEAGAVVSALDGRGAPGEAGGVLAAPARRHHAFVTLLSEAMAAGTDTLPGSPSALR